MRTDVALYDAALATKKGRMFYSIWFSANTRQYRFFDTTICPYRQDSKFSKSMGLVVDFANITRDHLWKLFVFRVKCPAYKSRMQTTNWQNVFVWPLAKQARLFSMTQTEDRSG
jgi:RNA polymerase subunit RPABC4/transcription elongation factor Spt4